MPDWSPEREWKANVRGKWRRGRAACGRTRDELAQTLSELARTLEAEDDTEAMLGDLVAAAVREIPGVDEGRSAWSGPAGASSRKSPSSDLPRRVDALQAKGILMERYRIDAGKAFALLVRTSQHTNLKLRDVTAELALTGRHIPIPPNDPR